MQRHFATGQISKAQRNKNVFSFDLKVFRQAEYPAISGISSIIESTHADRNHWLLILFVWCVQNVFLVADRGRRESVTMSPVLSSCHRSKTASMFPHRLSVVSRTLRREAFARRPTAERPRLPSKSDHQEGTDQWRQRARTRLFTGVIRRWHAVSSWRHATCSSTATTTTTSSNDNEDQVVSAWCRGHRVRGTRRIRDSKWSTIGRRRHLRRRRKCRGYPDIHEQLRVTFTRWQHSSYRTRKYWIRVDGYETISRSSGDH